MTLTSPDSRRLSLMPLPGIRIVSSHYSEELRSDTGSLADAVAEAVMQMRPPWADES